jgi:hypothetical protein
MGAVAVDAALRIRDRLLDLVAGNEDSSFVSLFLGRRNGTFSTQKQVNVGGPNSPVDIAQLDGKPGGDIASVLDINELVILLNRG